MDKHLHLAPGLEMNLKMEGLPSDVQMVIVGQEQEEWSLGLDQERLPHIKEEQEELWSSLNGALFEGLEEATAPTKTEPDDEKPSPVLCHQGQSEEACSIKTEAARDATCNSHPDACLQTDADDAMTDSSEAETEVSDDDRAPLTSNDDSEGDVRSENGFSCSGESLKRNVEIRTGEQPHPCSVCGKTFTQKVHLTRHMALHRQIKNNNCSGKMTQIQSQTEENGLTFHDIKAEADGERVGESEATGTLDSDTVSHPDSNEETSDSAETDPEDGDEDFKGPAPKSFSCSACNKSFTQRRNLIIHMRTHTGQDPFICFLCGKCFTRNSGLNYHLNTHTGDRPYTCSVCGKKFARKGTLKYHLLTHTGEKHFSCGVCKRRFRGQSQLKIHKCINDACQLPTKTLSCHDCDETFPSKYLLLTHLKIHKGKKLFTCSVCGQKWQFKSHLKIHMRSHTGERPHRCTVCGKGFSQKGIMTRHMAIHSEVKPYSCGACGKGFFWHCQVKKHNCRGRRLKSEDDKKALVISTDRRGPDIKKRLVSPILLNCSYCTRVFATGGHLTRHLSVHVGEKLLSCVICEKRCTMETQLLSHKCFDASLPLHKIKTEYSVGKKMFRCSKCGKAFWCRNNLQEHMRTHVGEPFSCSVCQEKFPKYEGLCAHMASHTGDKPFVCSVCNTEHVDSESLIKHMRIHTAQTQFNCLICDKGFAWRRSLVKHMEGHEKKKNYKCSVCDKRFTWPYQLSYHRCVPESSQLHRSEERTETELAKCSSPSRHIKTEDNSAETHLQIETDSLKTKVRDCDLSNDTREFQPDSLRNHTSNETVCNSEPPASVDNKASECAEPASDDSVDSDFWKENRQRKPGPKSAANEEVFESEPGYDSMKAQYSCPECGRSFLQSCHLWNHMRTHTGHRSLH